MISIIRSRHIRSFVLVVLTSATSLSFRQTVDKRGILASPVDEKTAVRFFYNPVGGDYFHFPLIFRAVTHEDPRLNTAPMGVEGRTAYISRTEMRPLMQKLAHLDVSWQESEKVEALGSSKQLPPWSDSMEILVVSSKGTARAKLDPKKICTVLKHLDSALKTPRALWELQKFRLNYGCQVPGFDAGRIPRPLGGWHI